MNHKFGQITSALILYQNTSNITEKVVYCVVKQKTNRKIWKITEKKLQN